MLDKGPVDLDGGSRYPLQIFQWGESNPEIVNGDADTQFFQFINIFYYLQTIIQETGFGEFEM